MPNRYFGVFQDGTLKVRGLEARRRDTPAWIAAVQMEIIERLARVEIQPPTARLLPAADLLLREQLDDLRSGRVPLEDLLVGQRLTRELANTPPPPPPPAPPRSSKRLANLCARDSGCAFYICAATPTSTPGICPSRPTRDVWM